MCTGSLSFDYHVVPTISAIRMIPEYDLRKSLLMHRRKIQLRFCDNKDGEFPSIPTGKIKTKRSNFAQTSDSKRMFNSVIPERVEGTDKKISSSMHIDRTQRGPWKMIDENIFTSYPT